MDATTESERRSQVYLIAASFLLLLAVFALIAAIGSKFLRPRGRKISILPYPHSLERSTEDYTELERRTMWR